VSTPNPNWRDFVRVHPALDIFPSASDDELRKLADDIDFHGLKVPIQTRSVAGELNENDKPIVYLIDGRKRLDAMTLLGWRIIDENGDWHGALAVIPGTVPKVVHRMGRTHAEIINEVRSLNWNRRHLSAKELVAVSASLDGCLMMFAQ